MTISSASSSRAARMVRAGRSSGRARCAPFRIERNADNGSAIAASLAAAAQLLEAVVDGEQEVHGQAERRADQRHPDGREVEGGTGGGGRGRGARRRRGEPAPPGGRGRPPPPQPQGRGGAP